MNKLKCIKIGICIGAGIFALLNAFLLVTYFFREIETYRWVGTSFFMVAFTLLFVDYLLKWNKSS